MIILHSIGQNRRSFGKRSQSKENDNNPAFHSISDSSRDICVFDLFADEAWLKG